MPKTRTPRYCTAYPIAGNRSQQDRSFQEPKKTSWGGLCPQDARRVQTSGNAVLAARSPFEFVRAGTCRRSRRDRRLPTLGKSYICVPCIYHAGSSEECYCKWTQRKHDTICNVKSVACSGCPRYSLVFPRCICMPKLLKEQKNLLIAAMRTPSTHAGCMLSLGYCKPPMQTKPRPPGSRTEF